MEKIGKGKVAEIEYTLRLADGEIVDSTEGKPLPYLHGVGYLIDGLENALEGHQAGDNFSISVTPDAGYGEVDEDLFDEMPRSAFPEDAELEEGDEVTVLADDGTEMEGYIQGIEDDTVYVDFNHPLAGETLSFEVRVLTVRDATADEVAQGFIEDPYADEEGGDDHVMDRRDLS